MVHAINLISQGLVEYLYHCRIFREVNSTHFYTEDIQTRTLLQVLDELRLTFRSDESNIIIHHQLACHVLHPAIAFYRPY